MPFLGTEYKIDELLCFGLYLPKLVLERYSVNTEFIGKHAW